MCRLFSCAAGGKPGLIGRLPKREAPREYVMLGREHFVQNWEDYV